MENNKYTFWRLLDENIIEIPIIQRDYAQGRIEENEIRNKFLDVLYNKIKNVDETVNLDFVYGRRIIGEKLIPLDGQQRLTTLFLLHWYLAIKENKFDEASKKLQKFTYETRVSSREFCKALSTNKIDLLNINNFPKEEDKKLSKLIEDKNWFFKSWKKDPTIKSMLNMLDAIHEKFKNIEDNNLFDKLICDEDKKKAITFDFLPLNDFNLTDELYIKMNARGKPLTHFENFKSNFVELLDFQTASKLDNEWTDLFWSFRSKDYYIDDKFLNFFTNCIINIGLYSDMLDEKKDLKDINIINVYKNILSGEENIENLKSLISILNLLSDMHKKEKGIPDSFKNFIEINTSYWDRAKFHSLMMYLLKNQNDIDFECVKYKDWDRITKNIIDNFNMDSLKKLQDTLKLITNMSENIDKFYEYLASEKFLSTDKPNKGHRSLEFQQQEEQLKAKLVLENPNISWKETIIECELKSRDFYLDGHIGFLIEIAGKDIKTFKQYFEKFNKIFDEEKDKKIEDKIFLFQRALLSKGDYLVGDSEKWWKNKTFCSFEKSQRAKDDNWKQVFHSESKRVFLKDLLEDDRDLEVIINDFNDTNDWKYNFIKDKRILEYCSQYQIRMQNENDILILTKLQTNGKHAEYYTYSLYLEIKNDNLFNNIKYEDPNSIDLPKYISINNDNIKIYYGDFESKYQFKKESNNGEYEYYENKNDLLENLKNEPKQ